MKKTRKSSLCKPEAIIADSAKRLFIDVKTIH